LRFVKESIRVAGGSPVDIPVTNELLISTRCAYSRYKAHLDEVKRTEEEKKKQKEKVAATKRQLEESNKVKEKQQKEKRANLAKLEAKLSKINIEEGEKRGCQKTAQLLLKEAEEKLAIGIKKRDMDQISVAHAMLESGGQRLAVANSDIDELNKRKQEIEQTKRKLESKTNEDNSSIKPRVK